MGIFVALVVSFVVCIRAEQQLVRAVELRNESFLLADELRQSSDDLTKMVRIYAVTGEARYRAYYQNILDIRNGKMPRPLGYQKIYWDFVVASETKLSPGAGQSVALLELMRTANFPEQEFQQLENAKANSDQLSRIEYEAMALVEASGDPNSPQRLKAIAMLNDSTYHAGKAAIMKPIGEVYELMEKRTTKAIQVAQRDTNILRMVFIAFGLSLMYMLYRTNNFLRATLGGSIAQVYALISRIGRGNFAPVAALSTESENSVMGWLAKTQIRLNKLELARQHAEEALRENEARYRAMVEGSAEPILVHRDGALIYLNPSSLRVLGAHAPSELVGKPLVDIVHPDYHQLLRERVDIAMASGAPAPAAELKFLKVDGTVIDVEAQSALVMLDGVKSVQVSWRDITERKRLEDKVRQLAFFDALTKLPNRRLLDDRLQQSVAASKRSGLYGALMFLDLDNFKPLNDTHGHVVGDLLLVEAATRLKACVRDNDTVARFGGDEFVVMLSDLDAQRSRAMELAETVAQKIRTSLSQTYSLKVSHEMQDPTVVEHHCTASVGVVVYGHNEGTAQDFLKWADAAMYQAKAAGRNTVRFYDAAASAPDFKKRL
jgi:diguanylate cyclase (GGDEF)-like protein/PAS domain S-box-containing protein